MSGQSEFDPLILMYSDPFLRIFLQEATVWQFFNKIVDASSN